MPPLDLTGLNLDRQYFKTWANGVTKVMVNIMAAQRVDRGVFQRVQLLQQPLLRWFNQQWCNPFKYGVIPRDLPGAYQKPCLRQSDNQGE